ncbi:MAG: histidinol-phosphate transaminase [Leptospira sp.]|nr:histidinol-phosphate transaminase [Leptospira sp.]
MADSNLKYLRKELMPLVPYTPGEQPNLGEAVVKINTNENPYPPSPKILKKIDEILSKGLLRKYPHYNSLKLRSAIAKKYNLNPDQILVTNGSDEALRLLFQAVLGPGDKIIAPDPTYSLYPVLVEQLMCGVEFKNIPVKEDLYFDHDALGKEKGKLIAFAHPNAPTGLLEKKENLVQLIKNFDGIVLSDEAYIDFAPEGTSLINEIGNCPNLVISRTFSKSYSLAGLRVGFLIGEKNLIEQISKLKDSYNLGMLEQEIALAAFEDEEYFQKNISLLISERSRVKTALEALGFQITDSHTNFLFCKPHSKFKPEWIYESLKEKNILVRYFSKGIPKDYVRISVGSKSENDQLIQELKNLLK